MSHPFWRGYAQIMLTLWLLMLVLAIADAVMESPIVTYDPVASNMYTGASVSLSSQVVAAADIDAGTTLSADMLWERPVVAGNRVPRSYADPATLVGEVTARDILAGEVVTASTLLDAPIYLGAVDGVTPTDSSTTFVRLLTPRSVIPAGAALTYDDLTTDDYPLDVLPQMAIYSYDLDATIGRTTRMVLYPGQPLSEGMLLDYTKPSHPPTLLELVPADACAASASAMVSVYENAVVEYSSGTWLRANLDTVVVAREGTRVQLELVSGEPVGWVNESEVLLTGPCDDLE